MTSGRQISSSALHFYKLHNLVIPLRWTSTAKVTTCVDFLDDFPVRLVHENTKECHKKNYEYADQTKNVKKFNNQKSILKNNYEPKTEDSGMQRKIIETDIPHALSENGHGGLKQLLLTTNCSQGYLLKLFTDYSDCGGVETVIFLQEYTYSHYNKLYSQNGKFDHFLARAYCLRGNSQKGLSILSKAYKENMILRNSYRTIFRDLIIDSVNNRSVASLVTFREFVTKWSEEMNEHYPLVCLWHSCWSSSWFSDKMYAEELMEMHVPLRKIVADRASALTIYALVNSEDDAVVRLMQALLKYEMIEAYEQALQILFEFRLNNRDSRGCNEIIQNAKVLGLKLCNKLQSRYIHMIIDRGATADINPVKSSTSIKFKF